MIRIPSIPQVIAPINPIMPIKFLAPKRKTINGTKQAKIKERFFFNLKSYQNTFFKVRPKVKKK